MTTHRVDLKDAAAFFGNEWRKQFRGAALRGLLSAAQRGVQTIQTSIIPSRNPPPQDRGAYRASWRATATENGAEVWSDSPIADIVENGVRGPNVKPGRVMLAALADWAMRKGLVSDPVEAKRMAFAIAQNMKKRGIFNRGSAGLGVLREFMERYADRFTKEEVEREIRREIDR